MDGWCGLLVVLEDSYICDTLYPRPALFHYVFLVVLSRVLSCSFFLFLLLFNDLSLISSYHLFTASRQMDNVIHRHSTDYPTAVN